MKILLVEDDDQTSVLLSKTLVQHHFVVNAIGNGQAALELAKTQDYDLIVLDVMLPGLDGIGLCRQLRALGHQTPVLMMSAKQNTCDRVLGLEAGADDYIVKPVEVSEFIARIRALLRRRRDITQEQHLRWGELQLNPSSRQVTYSEQLLHLTPKEYGLLELLLRNPHRIFGRSALLDHLWPLDKFPGEEAVTTQVKGLRQKLKAVGMIPDLIETVYGLGYRLKLPPDEVDKLQDSETSYAGLGYSQNEVQVLTVVAEVWNEFKLVLQSHIAVFKQAISTLQASTDPYSGILDPNLYQQVVTAAHRLSGSLGSFGLPEGSQIAQDVEHLVQSRTALNQYTILRLSQLVELLEQTVDLFGSDRLVHGPSSELYPTPAVKQLLMITKEQTLIEPLTQYASNWNLTVKSASNLAIARQIMTRNPPDVILLDLSSMDATAGGMRFLAELTHQFPDAPVLVLSEQNELINRVRIAHLGCRTFLQKGSSVDCILEAISEVLNQTRNADAKVLITDDDLQILSILATLLKPWGLQVTTLNDPRQFWDVLEVATPDLLILDIEMPHFSGLDLCQVVRNDTRWGSLPILFLSAHQDAETVRQVFNVGADDYIAKPILEPELVARVLNRLERVRMRRRLSSVD
jgi:DNA-binding response OmpR family regulator